jgi:hypothetical protein
MSRLRVNARFLAAVALAIFPFASSEQFTT